MPVVKIKELPVYYYLLDEIWQRKFNISLKEDKNIIENRKQFRQYIAQQYGLYTGEFDSKRFEDIFNGVRNTEYEPENIPESSIPISNYPGSELVEAYCHLYYELPSETPSQFKETAKTGQYWNRFLTEYLNKQSSIPHTNANTSKDFILAGINLCSTKQIILAAGILLSVIFSIGIGLYILINAHYFPSLLPPDQEIATQQKGYYLSLSISSLIQSLIILALIVVYHYDEDLGGALYVKSLSKGIIKTTLQQFQGGWTAIWVSLFFLYLWFAFKWSTESHFLGEIETAQAQGQNTSQLNLAYLQFKAWSWSIADIFNLIGPVLYFYLYFILDTESIATEQDPKEGPSRNQFFLSIMKVILILAVSLLVISVADRLIPLGDFQGIPTLFYSLFTSIAMSMFFGKLSSRFFNTSPSARVFFIPLFYLYAALQAVYGMLGFRNVHISVSLITMVFVLKIMLFFYISKLINKRKFDMYITTMLQQ